MLARQKVARPASRVTTALGKKGLVILTRPLLPARKHKSKKQHLATFQEAGRIEALILGTGSRADPIL
jgi:hypothetical protein